MSGLAEGAGAIAKGWKPLKVPNFKPFDPEALFPFHSQPPAAPHDGLQKPSESTDEAKSPFPAGTAEASALAPPRTSPARGRPPGSKPGASTPLKVPAFKPFDPESVFPFFSHTAAPSTSPSETESDGSLQGADGNPEGAGPAPLPTVAVDSGAHSAPLVAATVAGVTTMIDDSPFQLTSRSTPARLSSRRRHSLPTSMADPRIQTTSLLPSSPVPSTGSAGLPVLLVSTPDRKQQFVPQSDGSPRPQGRRNTLPARPLLDRPPPPPPPINLKLFDPFSSHLSPLFKSPPPSPPTFPTPLKAPGPLVASPSSLSDGSPPPAGEGGRPPTHFLNNFSLSPHNSMNRRHSVAPPPSLPPFHCSPMTGRRRASAGDLDASARMAAMQRRRGSINSPKAEVPVRPPSIPIDAEAVDPFRNISGEGPLVHQTGLTGPRLPPSPTMISPVTVSPTRGPPTDEGFRRRRLPPMPLDPEQIFPFSSPPRTMSSPMVVPPAPLPTQLLPVAKPKGPVACRLPSVPVDFQTASSLVQPISSGGRFTSPGPGHRPACHLPSAPVNPEDVHPFMRRPSSQQFISSKPEGRPPAYRSPEHQMPRGPSLPSRSPSPPGGWGGGVRAGYTFGALCPEDLDEDEASPRRASDPATRPPTTDASRYRFTGVRTDSPSLSPLTPPSPFLHSPLQRSSPAPMGTSPLAADSSKGCAGRCSLRSGSVDEGRKSPPSAVVRGVVPKHLLSCIPVDADAVCSVSPTKK